LKATTTAKIMGVEKSDTTEGTYKWIDNENIETTLKDKTEKVKIVKLTDTELELEGKMGDKTEKITFTKAK
jgi:hypothetical protein